MSRITATFNKLKAENKKALIPYITAGDPNPEVTVPLMHAMVESGVDIIELGVPFSDPMADGPTIQQACERALKHHVRLKDVIAMVKQFREKDESTPVVLMGYLNPIEIMGYENFAKHASEAGVDGVLTVDMPPEEAAEVNPLFDQYDIDPVFLVSPESTVERFKIISENSRGFLYYVSLKGVTGVKSIDVAAVAQKMEELREFTDLPLGVGFGINDAETAKNIAGVADAVVVGSAIVRRVAANKDDTNKMIQEVSDFLKEIRSAIDSI